MVKHKDLPRKNSEMNSQSSPEFQGSTFEFSVQRLREGLT
jgi:hypothetical protein